jgi:hypothetical protein
MQRLLRIALIAPLLLMLQPGEGRAAGPYDGEWSGSAAAAGGRCRPAIVTLTVAGKVVSGEARFEAGPQNILGTVHEDGAFGATIGFQHLIGKFTENTFEGSFSGFNCAWTLVLKRKK